MKIVIGCLIVGIAVVVNAQEFTSASANMAKEKYQKTLAQANKTYIADLESALLQAQSSKDSGEVERIKDAMSDIRANQPQVGNAPGQLTPLLSFKTVKVPGGKRPGYLIGKVSKGDKIHIQYVRGMFSVTDQPLLSPDVTDKVKCLLVTKMGEEYPSLAIIPTGTKEKSFDYTFDADFTSVGLNNGEQYPWNAKGEVFYKIAIERAK